MAWFIFRPWALKGTSALVNECGFFLLSVQIWAWFLGGKKRELCKWLGAFLVQHVFLLSKRQTKQSEDTSAIICILIKCFLFAATPTTHGVAPGPLGAHLYRSDSFTDQTGNDSVSIYAWMGQQWPSSAPPVVQISANITRSVVSTLLSSLFIIKKI